MRRPEEQLHRSVVAFLRSAVPGPPEGVWFTHPHNEGRRTKVDAAVAKAMGQRAGTPDLLLCHRGRLIAIELKAPKGRVSEAQAQCQHDLTLAGAVVTTVRSLEEFAAFIEQLGVPVKGRVVGHAGTGG
jgi:hypothetical protein